MSETEFELFRRLIKKHVGISFSHAKKGTLQRKLASRLSRLGLTSYNAYYRYLLHDKEGGLELRQLINTITVDQTAFFRDAKQFELLASIVLPQIAVQKNATKKLRIWCAGCATGQEAYSIAMLVSEMLERKGTWDYKILATDIDTDALKFAYKGKYPMDCVQPIPLEYLDRYFKRSDGKASEFFTVRECLKKNLLFRRLNFVHFNFVFKNPVDIILCRNVMIYFDTETKKKLIDNFFRIMHQDGFLCLGASESLIGVDERFILVGHSIYQKKG
ncbi:MAG: protein-glutamate O-methyltransferase CheR [Deltaproteobacteria bacterium]|nr:protein-glutamate O-methyltransferase CheR [Deltaproteobacteria bacterium]